eukprot:7379582-Prymnesium_polylepis.1
MVRRERRRGSVASVALTLLCACAAAQSQSFAAPRLNISLDDPPLVRWNHIFGFLAERHGGLKHTGQPVFD